MSRRSMKWDPQPGDVFGGWEVTSVGGDFISAIDQGRRGTWTRAGWRSMFGMDKIDPDWGAQLLEEPLPGALRLSRRRLKLTQAEAAENLGVSYPTYAGWERGHFMPRTHMWGALSEFFGQPQSKVAWSIGLHLEQE